MSEEKVFCQVCKKAISGKPMEYADKKFDTQECVGKFKKSEEQGVCEFC